MYQMPKFAFFEGNIVPFEEAKISVITHAFNFGTGAFGGIRGYWNAEQEQLYLFRVQDHYKRFLNSIKLLSMDLPYQLNDYVNITMELIRKEDWRDDIYIRPLVYIAEPIFGGPKWFGLRADFTVFCFPTQSYVENDEGAHVTISSWVRNDDNAIPARGKLTGAYANSAFIKDDAVRAGYDEALVLNHDGHISEGSAENVFMVKDGVLVTPPVTENILEGITRRSIMELSKAELGIEVVERPIDRTEIYLCDELFLTGTAAQITAIAKVDHHPISSGCMGPIVSQLRDLFFDVAHGRVEKYYDWVTPVYTAENISF
jgi:branched-chain amino acid aminotransferase